MFPLFNPEYRDSLILLYIEEGNGKEGGWWEQRIKWRQERKREKQKGKEGGREGNERKRKKERNGWERDNNKKLEEDFGIDCTCIEVWGAI